MGSYEGPVPARCRPTLSQELINKTSTTTGLKVFSRVSKKIYETGRSVFEGFKTESKIIHDNTLGDWNYMVFHNA